MENLEYITGKLYEWHGMQIPELQANVEVELGTGQKATEIAMQRREIMSKAERRNC
jgi:hypothetical protein